MIQRHEYTMIRVAMCMAVALAASGASANPTGQPYAVGPLDVNGGGTRTASSIYAISASVGQSGGVGGIASTTYAADDGFWYTVGISDCNDNGVSDDRDILVGTSQDCNTNAVPDECDIGIGTSDDCDQNQVPDECDSDAACPLADVNHDGVADGFDIAEIRIGTNWLRTRSEAANPCADVNDDGVIDGFDIAVIRVVACWRR